MILKISFVRLMAILTLLMSGPLIADDLSTFDGMSGQLSIAGGTAHIPVMKRAARKIMGHNSNIRITIAGGGSGVGVQQVAKELVDIGNTGRALKNKEMSLGLKSYPFAIDGVAVILHPENPVDDLSQQQIIDIYQGKITNWRELGGQDRQIHLFSRDEASGTRSVFTKKLLNGAQLAASANIVPSNGAMKTAVSQDFGAIGYSSVGYIDEMVKAPAYNHILPSQEACASGEYPVVRRLYMNTKGTPNSLTQAFIDYIYSKQGAEHIQASGYIALQGAVH
ncbi:phosphate ABC transporter substrate-binding protein [uncultured Shewanella sp.]|uniref:phosphate ABC transporter substrate-binding protein n=1 Tax=uncultured Shewanella sp. TaxID=173975 RepID=UPI002601CCAE|nr:phosphate ABC transporter substrate-binding protein [uncultured Shewanella sp.]